MYFTTTALHDCSNEYMTTQWDVPALEARTRAGQAFLGLLLGGVETRVKYSKCVASDDKKCPRYNGQLF